MHSNMNDSLIQHKHCVGSILQWFFSMSNLCYNVVKQLWVCECVICVWTFDCSLVFNVEWLKLNVRSKSFVTLTVKWMETVIYNKWLFIIEIVLVSKTQTNQPRNRISSTVRTQYTEWKFRWNIFFEGAHSNYLAMNETDTQLIIIKTDTIVITITGRPTDSPREKNKQTNREDAITREMKSTYTVVCLWFCSVRFGSVQCP